MNDKDDWTAWHIEREAFNNHETLGFARDLEALGVHIKTLIAICPKDKAGWPVGTALRTIDQLTADHTRFMRYLTHLNG